MATTHSQDWELGSPSRFGERHKEGTRDWKLMSTRRDSLNLHLLSCDREGHTATGSFGAPGGTCKELTVLAGVLSVDALGARRAFGRRTRDELSARRDDNSLVRGFLRDLSFLFLLRGHCESAYQLYKNVCTFPRKSFVATFCRSR